MSLTWFSGTLHKGDHFRTVVAVADLPEINSSRIEALETLTHNLHRRVTAEWLNQQLDDIEHNVTIRWSRLTLAVAAGCACASFGFLQGFSPGDLVVISLAAYIDQMTRVYMARARVHPLGCWTGAASMLAYFGW